VLTLARWLGPWADSKKAPSVHTREDALDGMRIKIFGEPRPRARTYLIAPGLHYAGADDPRLDRFCRVLASAGHLVVSPYIPDYLALVPTARAKADFTRAFDALPRWGSHGKPVVFSISFGSLLALALAAQRGDEIERVVLFGPYADLRATLVFCLTGMTTDGRNATRDPMNQPVVLMNLIEHLHGAPPPGPLRDELLAGWRRYIERVWGRMEMKLDDRYLAVAREVRETVPAAVHELYDLGTGITPGAAGRVLDALTRFDATGIDPTPYLSRVRSRVDLVHGMDDDVIPFEHSHVLAGALPHADVRVHITGLYGHTGTSGGSRVPRLATAAKELWTMLKILRAMS
jgi:pimeloyl-ACP methyl ester carboxylesterase